MKYNFFLLIYKMLLKYIIFIILIYLIYYFYYTPEKFTQNDTIKISNPIQLIDNFLSNKQCDELINLASSRFTSSTVYVTDRGSIDEKARSSSCAYFNRSENDLIKNIEMKVAKMLSININQIEPLQIARYNKGQQYKYHYDFFGSDTDQTSNQRSYTILVYLNDLDESDGGSTHFPLYKIRIFPYKGRAVLWNNLTDDEKENQSTLHAGEPVLTDKTKYVLTIWCRKYIYI